MKLSNKNNLPQVIVEAMQFYIDKRGENVGGLNADYSVTQLLSPPTIAVLAKRHKDEIVKDVSDCLYLLQGLVIHQLMENSLLHKDNEEHLLIEHPLTIDIANMKISGIPDVYDKRTKTLLDYKHPGIKSSQRNMDSYFMQTNIYRYMLEKSGYPVEKIEIILFYRDWVKSKALFKSEKNYPKSATERFTAPLMTSKQVHDYLFKRIQTIKAYEEMEILPACTEEERFQNPMQYAVMRPKNKKASKIFNSQEEAIFYINKKGWNNAFTEIRESEPTRCIGYCEVNNYCQFYADYLRNKEIL